MTKNEFIALALNNYDALEDGTIVRTASYPTGGKPTTSKTVKTYISGSGYPTMCLSVHGYRSTISVHRFVAARYYGISDLSVDHIDGDKLNNHYKNLEYVTIAENIQRHFATSYKPGPAHINRDTAMAIKHRLSQGEAVVDVAVAIGVSTTIVRNIKVRHTWKHL